MPPLYPTSSSDWQQYATKKKKASFAAGNVDSNPVGGHDEDGCDFIWSMQFGNGGTESSGSEEEVYYDSRYLTNDSSYLQTFITDSPFSF